MSILYRSDAARGLAWARYFAETAPDLDVRVGPDAGNGAITGRAEIRTPPHVHLGRRVRFRPGSRG